ncbi:hypothetical protein PR003_g27089 [Phytophthora rubi]|nr:hypothetical protein PR001_g25897 [Phytophthora rubi]KAE9283588.1 hypothetical protein PR003_g27089 [Phytophthora rubi]
MPAKFVDSVHETYLAKVTDREERLKASPINHDLRHLPPMFVQYGTLERFYDQGKRIIAKAKEQGVTNWEVDLLENMPHDVVMLPTDVSPAAKGGIRQGCEFAAKLAAEVLNAEPEPEGEC